MEDDFSVLQAEIVLAKALNRLGKAGPASAGAAAQLRNATIFAEVVAQAQLYESFRSMLAAPGFMLCWEQEGAQLSVRSPKGATWFEYRLVASMDAPLHQCLAPLYERDLIHRNQPTFVEPHVKIGAGQRHHAVVRTLSRVMSVYVETLFELVRVVNCDFGFLVESARSEFPTKGRKLPKQPWWSMRASLDTRNLWLPAGGNSTGTILVSVARVEVGLPIAESALHFVLHSFAEGFFGSIRNGSTLAIKEGSPWRKRLLQDVDGFYAELKEVEAAAAKRRLISSGSLPGPEIFDRPWHVV